MKKNKKADSAKRRAPAGLPAVNAFCMELGGNREALIEGAAGVLEYTPDTVRVNTADTMITVSGRELNLRCISASALIIDGFITNIGFSV